MFYSSLFDTGEKGPRDTVIAQVLLQVLALARRGPVLTAIHAFNSSLVHGCAEEGSFRTLIEHGRITFRARHDGRGPRQLFDAMLADPEYVYLGAWPELVNEKEARRATSALLRGQTNSTGLASVDERMDRTLKILDSIDTAVSRYGALQAEKRYSASFKDVFEQRAARAQHGLDLEVGKFLAELSRDDVPHGSRTEVYRELQQRAPDARTQAEATAFVDAISSAFVAESLGAGLHTASESPVVGFAHADSVTSGSIVALRAEDVRSISQLTFSWDDIAQATAVSSHTVLGSGESEYAIKRLATIYGKGAAYLSAGTEGASTEAFAISAEQVKEVAKSPAVLSALASGGAATVASSDFAFVGPVATLIAAILGAVVAKAMKGKLERRRIKSARRELMSFVGQVS
jgi:hypothetical protein